MRTILPFTWRDPRESLLNWIPFQFPRGFPQLNGSRVRGWWWGDSARRRLFLSFIVKACPGDLQHCIDNTFHPVYGKGNQTGMHNKNETPKYLSNFFVTIGMALYCSFMTGGSQSVVPATADPAISALVRSPHSQVSPETCRTRNCQCWPAEVVKSHWVILKHADLWGKLAQTDESKEETVRNSSPSWTNSQCFRHGIFFSMLHPRDLKEQFHMLLKLCIPG